MMEENNYMDIPQKRDQTTNEVYEYDSTATPKRITYIYEVSYVNNNSENNNKSQ